MQLVLLSGGLDSSVLLAYILDYRRKAGVEGCDEIAALSIDYSQRHSRELQSAKAIAEYYHVKHIIYDLNNSLFAGSLLTDEGEIPEVAYQDISGISPIYVPFRNGVFLSIAAAYCYSHGEGEVYLASHLGDYNQAAYPDCSKDFISHMDSAVRAGTANRVIVSAPFTFMTKADVVKLGIDLGVPFDLTWSCYKGGDKPCGVCPTCREREAAFREAGL